MAHQFLDRPHRGSSHHTECRIVDPATGADARRDEPGEVWVRGPQVMKGYLNNLEATSATVDAHGWLRTGDIGTVDEDGFLEVTDRLKELIKVKGYQVAPPNWRVCFSGIRRLPTSRSSASSTETPANGPRRSSSPANP
jgi:acyl-CoA synthetase (AMP-forming)/AMP-acid ligase II